MPSTANFNKWLDSKLKIDSIYEISKYSDLDEDWQWLQDKAFEFLHFYDE